MDAAILYLPLLGASLALSAAIALVVGLDGRIEPPLKGSTIGLCVAGAAYTGFVGPGAAELPRAVQALLLGASASGVVWLWAVVRLLFEPGRADRVVRQLAGVLLLGVALPVLLGYLQPELRTARAAWLSLLAAGLVLHGLALLLLGRHDDLDDYRRRMRLLLAAGASLYVLVVLAAWLAGALQGRPADAALWLAAAQVAIKLAWLGLTVGAPSPLQRLYGTTHAAPPRPDQALPADVPEPSPPLPSVAEAQAARQARAVLQAMEEQRLYREPGLSIGALAERVNLPEHRLRALINGQLDFKNYSAFLNHFRLREVARRLRDPAEAHLPILSIALDEGYASLAPFNRAFREAFGCSPSEYRRPQAATAGR